ncbi:MAG: hypothetical protein JWO46_572 [Nocardioidaceae bacterium]|nr:hypothetical protein [Nocardioidaceae bacterium]
MTDEQRLLGLLDVAEAALADFTTVVRAVPDELWESPTDLAGWSVHDLVSHTAHLESVIAGGPEDTVAVPDGLPHVVSEMGVYTEQGVIARRERSRAELLAEIESSAARRIAATRADPPSDGAGDPPYTPGGIGWSWNVLLSNRPLDVYMHEQDVRRAVDLAGNLDNAVSAHVVGIFGRGLGYVLGKRAGGTVGESVAVEITGGPDIQVVVGDDGRGARAPEGTTPTTTLRMDTETFLVLSGGRRDPLTQTVEVTGDQDLGSRFLAAMNQTP